MPIKYAQGIKLVENPQTKALVVVQGKNYKNPESIEGYVRDKRRPYKFWKIGTPEAKEHGMEQGKVKEVLKQEAIKDNLIESEEYTKRNQENSQRDFFDSEISTPSD